MITGTTEYVCDISNHKQREMLQQHFLLFYQMLADDKLIPKAAFKKIYNVYLCLSGISSLW